MWRNQEIPMCFGPACNNNWQRRGAVPFTWPLPGKKRKYKSNLFPTAQVQGNTAPSPTKKAWKHPPIFSRVKIWRNTILKCREWKKPKPILHAEQNHYPHPLSQTIVCCLTIIKWVQKTAARIFYTLEFRSHFWAFFFCAKSFLLKSNIPEHSKILQLKFAL